MRRIAYLLAAAVLSVFQSCASSSVSLAECTPVAVVTVVGNTSVPWADEIAESGGLISSALNKAFDGTNPERMTAQDRVDHLEESLRASLSDIAGVEVSEKERVLSSPAYKKMRQSIYNSTVSTVSASGYRDFSRLGAKSARILERELGVGALVLAECVFSKRVCEGTKASGTVCGVVTLSCVVLGPDGRESIIGEVSAETEAIPVSRYSYDKDALVSMFPAAIESAARKFVVANMGM